MLISHWMYLAPGCLDLVGNQGTRQTIKDKIKGLKSRTPINKDTTEMSSVFHFTAPGDGNSPTF